MLIADANASVHACVRRLWAITAYTTFHSRMPLCRLRLPCHVVHTVPDCAVLCLQVRAYRSAVLRARRDLPHLRGSTGRIGCVYSAFGFFLSLACIAIHLRAARPAPALHARQLTSPARGRLLVLGCKCGRCLLAPPLLRLSRMLPRSITTIARLAAPACAAAGGLGMRENELAAPLMFFGVILM